MTAKLSLATTRPASPPPPSLVLLLDLALALGLFVLALGIRLPNLLTVPRFTDEQLDVLYTIPLYRHEAVPLVGWDPYNGALFSYLLALALWTIGPHAYTPRLLVLLLGAAAVAATYLLGRRLGGPLAGAVAGGLLATSATHVVVNSHVSWSNALTPLFVTVAVLTLLPAATHGSGVALALGGLLFGLALQTHPSVMTLLPGLALGLLWRRPRLVFSRWLLLAGALFLLGYSNVIAYNLTPEVRAGQEDQYRRTAYRLLPAWRSTGESTLGRLLHQQQSYAEDQGGASYLESLGALLLNLPRVAASLVDSRPRWTDYLLDPSFWIYGVVLLLGLLWPLRHGNPLLALAALSSVALLPLFTNKFEPIFSGRYLMPLLPLAFAGFGALVADLWRLALERGLRVVIALGTAALVLYPLLPLVRYEQRVAEEGQINVDLIQTAARLQEARRPGEPLLLDEALGRRGLPADGDLLQSLRALLELRSEPYQVGPASPGKLEGQLGGARTALVVFAGPPDRDLEDRYRLIQLEERRGGRYGAYRLERRE